MSAKASQGAGPKFYPLLRFSLGVKREAAIELWLDGKPQGAGGTGPEVDGFPTACVEDAPFGAVNVFKAHVNVAFFHGASLADPKGLLEGDGKYMRHVKLRPGTPIDEKALAALMGAAYQDIQLRLKADKAA